MTVHELHRRPAPDTGAGAASALRANGAPGLCIQRRPDACSSRAAWRRGRSDHGSVVVEAVLIVPVLMLVLLVVIQCALWAHAGQVVRVAASEGDRSARSLGGGTATGIAEARAVVQASGSSLASSSVTSTLVDADQVQVTVTGRAVSIVPGLNLPVSAVVIGPVQEFRGSE